MPASLMRLAAQPPEAPDPTTMASYTCGRATVCMRALLEDCARLYCGLNATEKEIVMNDEVRNESATQSLDSGEGPLRHFRIGRRTVLQSLATGAAVVFASRAPAAHVHQAAAVAADSTTSADTGLLFLDQHAFDTLALLGEQIVPGSRAVKVPEFLDRLLAV